MDPSDETTRMLTRRHFFGAGATGIGVPALVSLLGDRLSAEPKSHGGLPGLPHFKPTARRVIYLFQSGGPSQMELFDHKPRLTEFQGQNLPESVRMGQRLTGMSASQSSFPVVPSKFTFSRHGGSGALVSELLPQTAKVADQLTFIKSVHTGRLVNSFNQTIKRKLCSNGQENHTTVPTNSTLLYLPASSGHCTRNKSAM